MEDGIRKSRRQPKTFIDILQNDSDCEEEYELRTLMMDREGWKVYLKDLVQGELD